MYIAIVGGSPGTGKTLQSLSFPPPILSLDLENRQHLVVERHFKERDDINVVNCLETFPKGHKQQFYVDALTTLGRVRSEIRGIITKEVKPTTLVIDGISQLREYAVDEWLQDQKKAGKNRKSPENAGDWGKINDIVRGIVFPIVNYCRVKDINLVLTCGTKDKYRDREVVGSELQVKDWVSYNVDYIYWLKANTNDEYLVECHKSPNGRGSEMVSGKTIVGFPPSKEVKLVPLKEKVAESKSME